jgi:hypothetical protein
MVLEPYPTALSEGLERYDFRAGCLAGLLQYIPVDLNQGAEQAAF